MIPPDLEQPFIGLITLVMIGFVGFLIVAKR